MNDTIASTTTERIREAIQKDPRRMTVQLARELKVPEAEVVQQMPGVVELDAARWEELVRCFEGLQTVHVIVTSGGATLEAVGEFGKFSTWGEFFNVQTSTLDMHIRGAELVSIFAVEKPNHMNGSATLSFQFFDRAGHAAFKVFMNFGGPPTPEKATAFAELRERFRKAGANGKK